MTTWKVKGVNDDTDTCELCGKHPIKRVVWMAPVDADGNEGAVQAIGRCCAAKLLKISETRIQRLAEQADETARYEALRTVHIVGNERSVADWAIESVGGNGGSLTLLGFANGLKSAVERWAEDRWPNNEVLVRKAR